MPIVKPYRLVSREFAPDGTVIEVDGRQIGDEYFGLIAGPCTVEYARADARDRAARSTRPA